MSDQFEQFWGLYPRKIAKGYARKAWPKALKLTDFDTIMDGVQRYADYVDGKDLQYVKHGASWLNSEGWSDEYESDGIDAFKQSLVDNSSFREVRTGDGPGLEERDDTEGLGRVIPFAGPR
jgi:hypothetical protein